MYFNMCKYYLQVLKKSRAAQLNPNLLHWLYPLLRLHGSRKLQVDKIETHAGADIPRHYHWRKILSVIHASFWRGSMQIQIMKLKFVHTIKFWHGKMSMPAWNLLRNGPLNFEKGPE